MNRRCSKQRIRPDRESLYARVSLQYSSLDHFATLLEEQAFARATQQFVYILLGGQIIFAVLLMRTIFP